MRRCALAFLLPFVSFLLGGCLFYDGKTELALLKAERGTPYAVTVFAAEPREGELTLAQLRRTMEHWSGAGSEGKPRWEGVLIPEPQDLYRRVLEAIDGGRVPITLTAYQYDATGLDFLTLVDYRDGTGALLGSDEVAYIDPPPAAGGDWTAGYGDMSWWEYPQLLLDAPLYLAIGVKEFCGEIAKSPISFIDSAWIGTAVENRNPVSPVNFKRGAMAVVEDWNDGWTALTFRLRVHHRHNPLETIQEVLGTVPVAGPIFDQKSPPDASVPPPPTTVIAVGQGIHAGGRGELFTMAWERSIREARPEVRVIRAPYSYGGVFDVIWSLLNISNGLGYDTAAQLIFEEGLRAGAGVELVGFSGSVQKSVAASKALRHAGITVNKLVGVAGPAAGFSCAMENRLLLGANPFTDPVILAEHAENTLIPLFPSNLLVQWVPEAGGHHIPCFPNPTTRAPESGYLAAFESAIRPTASR